MGYLDSISGLPHSLYLTEFGPILAEPPASSSGQGVRRLWISLVLSCLLHAMVMILPDLGERAALNKPTVRNRHSSPSVVTVSLVTTRGEKAPIPYPPVESGVVISDTKSPGAGDSAVSGPLTEGTGILPISGPVYFTTDQLTKRPQAVTVAELDTAATQSIIVSGAMILQLRIDDRGQVVNVDIEQNELPEIFAVTAINAFKKSFFTPGERNGIRVNSLLRIEVRYDDKLLSGR